MNEKEKVVLDAEQLRPWIYFILVFAVMTVAGCLLAVKVSGGPDGKYARMLEQAQELLDGHEYQQAITKYNKAVRIDEDRPEAYEGLADAYAKMAVESEAKGHEWEAEEYYREALDAYEKAISRADDPSETERKKIVIEHKLEDIQEYLEADNRFDDYGSYHSGDGAIETSDAIHAGNTLIEPRRVDYSYYDYWGTPRGNVIIVAKGGYYGAIDYDGNEIVPLTYGSASYFCEPTGEGHFVLSDDDMYCLFDADGKIIYKGNQMVKPYKHFYAVNSFQRDKGDDFNSGKGQLVTDYYSYNGVFVFSSRIDAYYEFGILGMAWPVEDENYDILFLDFTDVSDEHDLKDEELKLEDKTETEWRRKGWLENESRVITGILGNASTVGSGQEDTGPGELSVNLKKVYESRYGILDGDGNVSYLEIGGTEYEYDVIVAYGDGPNHNFTFSFLDVMAPYGAVKNGYFMTRNLFWGDGGRETRLYSMDGGDACGFVQNNYYYSNGELLGGGDIDRDTVDWSDMDCLSGFSGEYKNASNVYCSGKKMVCTTGWSGYLLTEFTDNGSLELLGEYDYLSISHRKYWLVNTQDKWGYVDDAGEVVKLYEDAGAFSDFGYAGIVKNGRGYIINEDLEEIQMIGSAYRTYTTGEMVVFQKTDGSVDFYYVN